MDEELVSMFVVHSSMFIVLFIVQCS